MRQREGRVALTDHPRRAPVEGGCRQPGAPQGPSPAVHHHGATEEVAEGVDPPAQLEEQVGVFGHPMVWPAGELNVGHLSSVCFFFFLVKRQYVL